MEKSEVKSISEARKAIKGNIKFNERLLDGLNSKDVGTRAKSVIAAWCLFDYVDKLLLLDIESAMRKIREPSNDEI